MSNACDCILGGVYFICWFIAHLFPIVGQCLALRIWVSPEKYMKSTNPTDRMAGHVGLFLGTYGIGYLLYLYFKVWNYCIENYESMSSKIAIFFLSFGTYTIYLFIKGWFNLADYATGNNINIYTRPFHKQILLFITSLGFYGLYIIFKLWFDLMEYGLRPEAKYMRPSHYIALIVGTCGLYIPYKIITTILSNWYNCVKYAYGPEFDKMTWKHHLAAGVSTLGLYLIFRFIYEWIGLGIYYAYSGLYNDTLSDKIKYSICATILSLGLYIIPFAIINLIRLWNYASKLQLNEYVVGGYLIKISMTLGLYIIILYSDLFQYLAKRHMDKKTIKPNAPVKHSRTNKLDKYLNLWHYKVDWPSEIGLMLITFGLYLVVVVLYLLFCQWKRGIKWSNYAIYIAPCFYSHNAKLFSSLINADKTKEISLYEYVMYQIAGHIIMIILTAGLFIIYRFIEIYISLCFISLNLRYQTYSLPNDTLRNCSSALGNLLAIILFPPFVLYTLGYIYVITIMKLNKIITSKESVDVVYKPFAMILILILTLGTALFWYYRFYVLISYKDLEDMDNSTNYKAGKFRSYFLSFGLSYIYFNYYSKSFGNRFISSLIIFVYFIIPAAIIYFVAPKFDYNYLLWTLPIVLYCIYEFSGIVYYNNIFRIKFFQLSCWIRYRFNTFSWYCYRYIGHKLYIASIKCSNGFRYAGNSVSNSLGRLRQKMKNNHFNIFANNIEPGQPNYYDFVPSQHQSWTWKSPATLDYWKTTFRDDKMVNNVIDSVQDSLNMVLIILKIGMRDSIYKLNPTKYQKMIFKRTKYKDETDPFVMPGYHTYSNNRFQDVDSLIVKYQVHYDASKGKESNKKSFEASLQKIKEISKNLDTLRNDRHSGLLDIQNKIKDKIFFITTIGDDIENSSPPVYNNPSVPAYDDSSVVVNVDNDSSVVNVDDNPPAYTSVSEE